MKKVLIKPLITEKTINLAKQDNKFSFLVNPETEKIEISKEISKKFNVTVLDIKTINFIGKKIRFGKKRIPGQRKNFKKAILTLKKGDKIAVFDIK